MIPFDVALVPGSGLWFVAGSSDGFLVALSAGVIGMGLTDITAGITDRLGGNGDGGEELGEEDDLLDDGDGALDDEFGDLDGWDDGEDEFDDFGGGDALDEFEPRIDELENEVASISSTIGTVRSENEAINETVHDIEDNVRKLLEIYEMVTRGVNPFVDEAEGAAGMGGSFGLFDGDESGGDSLDDLDPEVAEADADSFFDDDWDEDGFDDFDDVDEEGFDDVDEEGFDDAEPDDAADAMEDAVETESDAGSEEGGKTFEQLKSEYDEGEAEWTGGDDEAVSDDESGTGAVADDERDTEPPTGEDDIDAAAVDDAPGEDDTGVEPETATTADVEPGSGDAGSSTADDNKPYLQTLPGGYGTELLVIEWLSYLRSCSSTPEALRAVRYYETIGWIGQPAADTLAKFLTGLTDEAGGAVPSGGTQLTVDHHTQSLRYIGRLGGTEVQIERLDWAGSAGPSPRAEGGTQRGIQR